MRSLLFCCIASVCLTLSPFAPITLAQDDSQQLFERARMLDLGNRNNEAIRFYTQFISSAKANRASLAEAQYRIAALYERLGRKADAERAYDKLVGGYRDQSDVVRRARFRLAALARGKPREFVVNKTGPSADGLILTSFAFPSSPSGLSLSALDPVGRKLYLFTQRLRPLGTDGDSKRAARRGLLQVYEPSTMVVLDLDSLTIVKTMPMPVSLGAALFDPASNRLYALAKADGELRVIDPVTFNQQRIALEGFPADLALNPRTNRIYVSCEGFNGNDKLFVIDGATESIVARCDLGGVAGSVVVNPETNRVYVSTGDPAKTRIFDGTDNSPIEDIPSTSVVAVDRASGSLYALAINSSGVRNAVLKLDPRDHHNLATLLAAGDLSSLLIAVSDQSRRVFVGLPNENQIAVIDSTTGVEANRLSVPYPARIALDQITGRVFLGHAEAGTWSLSVLDPQRVTEQPPEEFSDDFDADTLSPDWMVIPGRGTQSLVENRGFLRYWVAPRSQGASNEPTMLTRKFRGDHWTLEVKASYWMGTTGGERNLAFSIAFGTWAGNWEKASVSVKRHRGDWDSRNPGLNSVLFNQKHVYDLDAATPPNDGDSYTWRVIRNGRTITVERSDDGIKFVTQAQNTFGPQIDGLIQYFRILGDSFGNADAYGDFDYVRLTRNP